MAKRSTRTRAGKTDGVEQKTSKLGVSQAARSRKIAEKGISTGDEFTACMSALMADLLSERVPIAIGNAVCSAGRNMLAVVALQMRLNGVTTKREKRQQLVLAPATT